MLSFHNLVVALIPATLVSVPALQVGIMGIVVCVKLTTQSLLWPWRVDVANYNDMVLSAGLLMLLLLASPLLNLNEQKAMEFVAVLLACVMFLLPIAALLAASAAVCFRLRPQSKYSMFLCHHKAGAGALCRFIKLIVHKYGRMNIFLDSDELDDLSRIFEIVSSDTRCLVAVLTPDLLQRTLLPSCSRSLHLSVFIFSFAPLSPPSPGPRHVVCRGDDECAEERHPHHPALLRWLRLPGRRLHQQDRVRVDRGAAIHLDEPRNFHGRHQGSLAWHLEVGRPLMQS